MSTRSRSRGFTLVELLVVIFIIGLLAAIALPTIASAIASSQRYAMSAEINGMKQGLEAYKQARGEYPPNFSEGASPYYTTMPNTSYVRRHLGLGYPKMNFANGSAGATFFTGGMADSIDEAESLVFWLCYTMDDVRDPFSVTKSGSTFTFPKAQKIFFNFDVRRLDDYDGDGFYAYKPKYAKDTHFVYFDSRSYFNTGVKYSQFANARPYFVANGSNSPTQAVAPTTFQIICAGRDGEFGAVVNTSGNGRKDITFGNSNAPTNISLLGTGDRDNLTSFSEGKVLEDLLP